MPAAHCGTHPQSQRRLPQNYTLEQADAFYFIFFLSADLPVLGWPCSTAFVSQATSSPNTGRGETDRGVGAGGTAADDHFGG